MRGEGHGEELLKLLHLSFSQRYLVPPRNCHSLHWGWHKHPGEREVVASPLCTTEYSESPIMLALLRADTLDHLPLHVLLSYPPY